MESLNGDHDCPLKYRPWLRQYVLTVPVRYLQKNEVCVSYTITHCPRCGAALPPNLVDQWFDIVEKEFGIIDTWDDEQMKNLPQEFKTDEWWKKRGL